MAGMAGSAKRQFDTAAGAVVVDEYLAGMQSSGESHLTSTIAAPDRGNQTEIGAVGNADRIFVIVKGDDHLHGAENFLLCQDVIRIHLCIECRRNVIASLPGLRQQCCPVPP